MAFWPEGFWPAGFWPNLFWGDLPEPGFRLYDRSSATPGGNGVLLTAIDPDPRALPVSSLGLADGVYELGLTRVSADGCRESEPAMLTLTVGGGGATQTMTPATLIVTRAVAGGSVALRFLALDRPPGRTAAAAAYEVAEAGELATILHTFTASGGGVVFAAELGPFADGEAVDLRIRASDGVPAGARGGWVAAPRVVADASGPVPADVLPVVYECPSE